MLELCPDLELSRESLGLMPKSRLAKPLREATSVTDPCFIIVIAGNALHCYVNRAVETESLDLELPNLDYAAATTTKGDVGYCQVSWVDTE